MKARNTKTNMCYKARKWERGALVYGDVVSISLYHDLHLHNASGPLLLLFTQYVLGMGFAGSTLI